MKAKDYPDAITIGKLKNGKYRYSIRYKAEKVILQSTKSVSSPHIAFNDAKKAMKAKAEGTTNLID